MDTKILKKIAIWLCSIIICFYVVLAVIVPNVINLNNYKSDVQKIIYDTCKLNLDFENAKLVITPVLSVGVRLKNIQVTYPDGTKLAYAADATAKLNILPIIFKTFTVDTVKIEKPQIQLDILPDDRLKIEKHFSSLDTTQDKTENTQPEQDFPDFKIKLNKMEILDYALIFKDLTDSLNIKGEKIIVSNVVLNKHASLFAKGAVYINNSQNIVYNFDIDTFLTELTNSKPEAANTNEPFIFNPVKAFKTYDLKADVKSKLKIRNNDTLDINGFADISGLSLALANKKLPQSALNIKFSGKNADIKSDLNISSSENINISGLVGYGKKRFADISVKTDKIYMKSLQDIITGFLDSLAIRHDAEKITPNGYLQADFNLKTNNKNITSDGYFNVVNASFIHKTMPVSLKDINVNINFARNKIDIKNCKLFLNDILLEAKGSIDTDTNTDININTQKMQIEKLYNAFAPQSIKKSFDISNGLLSCNINIKGKFEQIKPQIKLILSNFKMKEKTANINIEQNYLDVNLISDLKGYKGTITQTGEQISTMGLVIKNPKSKIDFNDKEIIINKFPIYVNSSPVNIDGTIKDYLKKPDIKVIAAGSLKTADIAKILPSDVRGFISYKGELPLNATVIGSLENLLLNCSLSANSQNYFTPITINQLAGQASKAQLSMEMTPQKLTIQNSGLYSNSNAFAEIKGSVNDLDKKVQKLNVSVNLPKTLSVSVPALKQSSMNCKGQLNISGAASQPEINGSFNIDNIKLADLFVNINQTAVDIAGNNINVKVNGADINKSLFDADMKSSITNNGILKISKLILNSSNIDADKLFEVADKATKMFMPQTASSSASSNAAAGNIPVSIVNGQAKISKFKMGDIKASDISGNFNLYNNLLKVTDFNLKAYDGNISGTAFYNLITTAMGANVKGNGIDANKVVTVFANLKDQIMGTASFSANVTLKGVEYSEQMKSLKGKADFEVKNGQLGSLGKFENFIKAPNIISQSLINTSIGSIVNSIAPYNSSQFEYLKGNLVFSNGVANLSPINSSGANMALNMSGTYNLVNNNMNIVLLGRISSKLSAALGPVSQLSADKISSYLPKYGKNAMTLFSALTDKSTQTDLNKIPALTPPSENSQEFKVVLNGNAEKPATVVKSFKWLSSASEYADISASISNFLKESYGSLLENTTQSVIKTVSENAKVQQTQQRVQQTQQKVLQTQQNVKQQIENLQNFQQSPKGENIKKLGNFLKELSEN